MALPKIIQKFIDLSIESSGSIKDAVISGKKITFTRNDGSTFEQTTQDTTYSNMGAASASAAGKAGLVPAPAAGDQEKCLTGAGTFAGPFLPKAGGTMEGTIVAPDGSTFPVANSAAAHNAVYRGKNLTGIYTLDQISAKIQANDWSDLYIGDSIEVSMTSSYGTETVRWLFAGFDWYMNVGDTAFTNHHIVMVPEDAFTNHAQMNSSNDTTGAYYNSAMHQTVLPAYASALKASSAFGSHLATYRALLTNTMTSTAPSGAGAGWSGASTDWSWYDTDLRLMTEVEVYGSRVGSSSLFDIGIGNRQLPLFQLAPQHFVAGLGLDGAAGARWTWWLSAVATSTAFAFVHDGGDAGHRHASHSSGVRPLFLFI